MRWNEEEGVDLLLFRRDRHHHHHHHHTDGQPCGESAVAIMRMLAPPPVMMVMETRRYRILHMAPLLLPHAAMDYHCANDGYDLMAQCDNVRASFSHNACIVIYNREQSQSVSAVSLLVL